MKLKYYFPIVTWSVLIIFLLSQVLIPSSVALAESESQTGMIAGIEIEVTKKSEIQAQIASEVEKWKTNDIIVHGTTAKIVIPSNYVNFDIKKTVDHYIAITSKPWYQFWGSVKNIQIPIELSLADEVSELLKEAPLFYAEETIAAIKDHASLLKYGAVEPEEVPLSKEIMNRISFELQDIKINTNGLSQILEALNDTTVLNGESFSFLHILEKADSFYNSETANFVASTIYSTVLQSELDIQERHSQNTLPNYLQPGVEVKVDRKRNQDFAFTNQTNRPVTIYASLNEGRLSVELYSLQTDTKVTIKVMNKEVITPRTIQRLTPTLAAGKKKVDENGANGLRVQIYRTISSNSYEKDELISRDFYPPKNKVILVSSIESPVTQGTPGENNNQLETPSNPNPNNPGNNSNGTGTGGNGDTNDEEDDGSESDGKEYDKGGNLITSDSE